MTVRSKIVKIAAAFAIAAPLIGGAPNTAEAGSGGVALGALGGFAVGTIIANQQRNSYRSYSSRADRRYRDYDYRYDNGYDRDYDRGYRGSRYRNSDRAYRRHYDYDR